jgi:dTDP-glucose 4,6-dehydratase
VNNEAVTVYGDGKATRSFTYVSDLVDGMVRLLLSDEPMPVNVGNPREMTITEFAEAVLAAAGPDCQSEIAYIQPKKERIADDPQRRKPDITRAKTILGWEPRVTLEEGLQPTLEYFKQAAKVS